MCVAVKETDVKELACKCRGSGTSRVSTPPVLLSPGVRAHSRGCLALRDLSGSLQTELIPEDLRQPRTFAPLSPCSKDGRFPESRHLENPTASSEAQESHATSSCKQKIRENLLASFTLQRRWGHFQPLSSLGAGFILNLSPV